MLGAWHTAFLRDKNMMQLTGLLHASRMLLWIVPRAVALYICCLQTAHTACDRRTNAWYAPRYPPSLGGQQPYLQILEICIADNVSQHCLRLVSHHRLPGNVAAQHAHDGGRHCLGAKIILAAACGMMPVSPLAKCTASSSTKE